MGNVMSVLKNKYFLGVAVAVWAVFIISGWAVISRYQDTPGQTDGAAEQWPSASRLQRTAGMPVMVMFVHPLCPCSRASVNQLARIMLYGIHKVRMQVVFVKHPEFSLEEMQSDLWKKAGEIPGVETVLDDMGAEAKMFHANVSGQIMLYDADGRLVYNGGITASRGHEGDNEGQDAIIAFLNQGIRPKTQTPPFGCLLFSKNE